jgi:hypothetical protein
MKDGGRKGMEVVQSLNYVKPIFIAVMFSLLSLPLLVFNINRKNGSLVIGFCRKTYTSL